MKLRIDLNADLGESSPNERELMDIITSASIATGFHAGDPVTIRDAIGWARAAGVAIGAHFSLSDRENFGRVERAVAKGEVFSLTIYQIGAFNALMKASGLRTAHVKPHGALYNMAARTPDIAREIAEAVAAIDPALLLFAPPRSELERAGEQHGLCVAREVFADRNYMADGSLVPRSRPDALLHDPNEAAARVVRMLREGVVRAVDGSDVLVEAETICVHGDTPDAVAFARSLRERLEREGITVSAPKIETKSAWSRRALAPTERRIIADRPEGGPAPFSAGPASFRNGPARNRRAPLGRAGFGHLTHLPSFYENSIVFFTTCAYGRRKILAASQCHEILRRLWERSAVRDGWWVGHYILMPDHVHFFARAGNEARSIASWVQMWKSVASRQIAAAFGIDPPIWQPEYFDRYLRSTESYSEKWDYVERNPLRGGLVKRVEEWPYRGTIHDLRF